MTSTPKISVVIPCHNEAGGIAHCIQSAYGACSKANLTVEIIVVDNASTDNTKIRAQEAGARVVSEAQIGYGRALRRGFAEAHGDIIIFGDGDTTYDFNEIPRFVSLLKNADFVTGERRYLAPRSMPPLHKYIGRPLFAFIIRYIFGVPVYDSHSGFGAIKKNTLQQLVLTSTGMEFASEILITAYRNNVQILSTPIYYAPRIGKSKLHTFRDGLRHLHYMGKALLLP